MTDSASVSRKSALIFGTRLLVTVMNFVGFYFVAHRMGPEVVGLVGYAAASVGIFTFILDPGLNDAHLKHVGEGKNVARCVGAYLCLKAVLALTLIGVLVGIVMVPRLSPLTGVAYPRMWLLLLIAIASALLSLIENVSYSTLAGLQLTARQEFSGYAGLLSVPLRIVVALRGFGALALSLANFAGVVASAVAALAMLRRVPIAAPDRATLLSYIRFARPLALSVIVGIVAANIDKFVTGHTVGATELGYLVGAQGLLNYLNTLSLSIMLVMFPEMSRKNATGDLAGVCRMTQLALKHIGLALMPVIGVLIVFRDVVIDAVLGAKFAPAATPFVLAALATLVFSLSRTYSYMLVATANQRGYSQATIAGAVVGTIATCFFIPTQLAGFPALGLGATGAAAGVLMGRVVTLVGYIHHSRRAVGLGLSWEPLKQVAAVLVMMGAVMWIRTVTGAAGWSLVPIGLLAGAIYLAAIWQFNGLSPADVQLYVRTLNVRAMGSYVRRELFS